MKTQPAQQFSGYRQTRRPSRTSPATGLVALIFLALFVLAFLSSL
jgi:hypothetical protein